MTVFLLGAGAILGAIALGFPGLFLGAGLGYALALLIELRQRIDRLERNMEIRQKRRRPLPPEASTAAAPPRAPATPASAPRPEQDGASPPVTERYPEDEMVDAFRVADDDPEMAGDELDDLTRHVAAGRDTGPPAVSRDGEEKRAGSAGEEP